MLTPRVLRPSVSGGRASWRDMSQVAYRPRRALMYVPGNDERKIAKIPSLGADCVCLDCEDGVAVNKKEAARSNIRNILDSQSIDFGKEWLNKLVEGQWTLHQLVW